MDDKAVLTCSTCVVLQRLQEFLALQQPSSSAKTDSNKRKSPASASSSDVDSHPLLKDRRQSSDGASGGHLTKDFDDEDPEGKSR